MRGTGEHPRETSDASNNHQKFPLGASSLAPTSLDKMPDDLAIKLPSSSVGERISAFGYQLNIWSVYQELGDIRRLAMIFGLSLSPFTSFFSPLDF